MGRVAAWRMAIRRPKEYCSKVDGANCKNWTGVLILPDRVTNKVALDSR